MVNSSQFKMSQKHDSIIALTEIVRPVVGGIAQVVEGEIVLPQVRVLAPLPHQRQPPLPEGPAHARPGECNHAGAKPSRYGSNRATRPKGEYIVGMDGLRRGEGARGRENQGVAGQLVEDCDGSRPFPPSAELVPHRYVPVKRATSLAGPGSAFRGVWGPEPHLAA